MKEKIRKHEAARRGAGYANACEIWKGWGEMGQSPFGWWVRPIGRTAHFVGSNASKVEEFYAEARELR